jgi:hypothetical protein
VSTAWKRDNCYSCKFRFIDGVRCNSASDTTFCHFTNLKLCGDTYQNEKNKYNFKLKAAELIIRDYLEYVTLMHQLSACAKIAHLSGAAACIDKFLPRHGWQHDTRSKWHLGYLQALQTFSVMPFYQAGHKPRVLWWMNRWPVIHSGPKRRWLGHQPHLSARSFTVNVAMGSWCLASP